MKFGLIGRTLKHSYSKIIHEMITPEEYELLSLEKEEVISFLQAKNFSMINVTIPYKEFVIPYLDEVSEEVKAIGACNCIVNRNNCLFGYNTDYLGLKDLLSIHHVEIENKVCAILGTGGTKNTAEKVLKDLFAKEILIVSRNKKENCITYEELKTHKDVEVIINATPLGMYPNNFDEPLINLNDFPILQTVIDVIYNPLNTKLICQAKLKGIDAYGGLEMLISQAIYAQEVALNKKFPPSLFKKIYKKLYLQTKNIVLIGLPMSGKTTIGKKLAKSLKKEFVDIDEEIVKYTNKSIPEIFYEVKEEGFRKIESDIIKKFSSKSNLVISTGGGVILNEENMLNLKQNGFIIYLDRDIDKMIYSDNRPLTKSQNELLSLKEVRLPLYLKYQDEVVTNSSSVSSCIKKIKEIFHESINY